MDKVLIVDDEKSGRKLISKLLKDHPCQFEIRDCQSDEAMDLLRSESFDFVLAQSAKPEHGIALIEKASSVFPDISYALFSSKADFAFAQKAMKLGVREYLIKPVDPLELYGLMDRLTQEKRRQERKNILLEDFKLISLLGNSHSRFYSRELDTIAPYARMMLIHACSGFFSQPERFERQLKTWISIPFKFLHINMEESILFFEENNEKLLQKTAAVLAIKMEEHYLLQPGIAVSRNLRHTSRWHEEYIRLRMQLFGYEQEASLNPVGTGSYPERLAFMAGRSDLPENRLHKEVLTVRQFIESHYSSDLSVDLLADYVCLAPSYLSHIFKKETGENLGKFIKRIRMERARDMLENTCEKIITISAAVGYQNVSYFCQSFREYYGISPQKFRSLKDT